MSYNKNNVFAKILSGEMPSCPVFEDDKTYAFMDIMPASLGHTLVIPKKQAQNILELDQEHVVAVAKTVKVVAAAIKDALNPTGMMITQLNGEDAGQTVFHYHVHIIPAYPDNPMKIHTKKIAENKSLEATANEIKKRLG